MNKRTMIRRIEALRSRVNLKIVTFVMTDNSRRTMERDRFCDAVSEAILGINSPETETLLASVSDNSGSQLVELVKMCVTTGDDNESL
jgi:hypothetical protein